jgi:C4-type Zn-finger protein
MYEMQYESSNECRELLSLLYREIEDKAKFTAIICREHGSLAI